MKMRKKPGSGDREKLHRIAIIGLPNTGKSQVYNELTGDYTLVANYPLTTIETKRKKISRRGIRYEIIDTPGLYSLYMHSEEEIAVRKLLFEEPPDGIIQCIDANRLKQSLQLTLDLVELRIPFLISMNAVEETEGKGGYIDARRLAERLGVKVIEHSVSVGKGSEELQSGIEELTRSAFEPHYGTEIENMLREIEEKLPVGIQFLRKKALLLLESDRYIADELESSIEIESYQNLMTTLDQVKRSYKGNINRELGKKRALIVESMFTEAAARRPKNPGKLANTFAYMSRHPVWGFPILAVFIVIAYLLVVQVAGIIDKGLTSLIVDPIVTSVDRAIQSVFWKEFLIGPYGLLTLGLFNALITVLPILSLFFLFMGILEDIGYLPNLTVLTQRALGRIGLSGRSVMSLVLGFGCKTMATLTTKGIPSRKERYIAIYLIAFAIPCSAQLAIDIAVLGKAGFSAFLIAFGTLAIVEIAAGFILNRIIKDDEKSDFIQELPPIRIPNLRAILKKTFYRLYWFLKEALPIFVLAAVALFFIDKIGLLNLLKNLLRPVVVDWLGLPLSIVEVLILSLARHEAAAGLLLKMVDGGALDYIQVIVAVVITTMFVPCFANIVAMCKQIGIGKGLLMALIINISSFVLAGVLHWILVLFS